MRVAVLITVYNSMDRALRCLARVYRQIDSLAGEGKYSVDIYLNDDASSDGLSEAVASKFPGVRLVPSGERQYPNRGLRLAWLAAASEDYDFYLWLDHTLELSDGAFGTLLENSGFLAHKAVVVGSVNAADGRLLHGGRSRSGKLIAPDATIPVPCHTFDGNLVLVPRHAFRTLGTVDAEFQQELGSRDYGCRASKAGISRVIAPGILASCDRVQEAHAWQDSSLSLAERYRALNSPEGRPPRQLFAYDLRSKGLLAALWGFVAVNFRTIFARKRK